MANIEGPSNIIDTQKLEVPHKEPSMQRLQPTISNSSTLTNNSGVTSNTSSSPSSPSLTNPPSNSNSSSTSKRRQKNLYNSEVATKSVIQLCNQYIKENNHLGLALIARQKGIPPTLRHKIWPILLKYHPNVINPYLSANVENDSDNDIPDGKIKTELMKYFRIRNEEPRSGNVSPDYTTSPLEEEIVRILEASIVKFFNKWGAIIKYDPGFAWIALNLAEWFPPIPSSNYVLIGRDVVNKNDLLNKHLIQISEQEFTLDNQEIIEDQNSETESQTIMTFAEVYERLVLVLLHSNENEDGSEHGDESAIDHNKNTVDLISANNLNKLELLFKSGNIESRISFFLIAFAKLLPELYKSLSEEEIINSNSNKNNQWLTWWFKYCGAKVFNKFDRGRLWDTLLGFRLSYSSFEEKYYNNSKLLKRFKKFYNDDDLKFQNELGVEFNSDIFWYKPSMDSKNELKWSQIDYQLQLVFIYISVLQRNESKLLEYDQFEIKNLLNKVPNIDKNLDDQNNLLINNSDYVSNDVEKLFNEAGELWRNWLWNEIRDEINE